MPVFDPAANKPTTDHLQNLSGPIRITVRTRLGRLQVHFDDTFSWTPCRSSQDVVSRTISQQDCRQPWLSLTHPKGYLAQLKGSVGLILSKASPSYHFPSSIPSAHLSKRHMMCFHLFASPAFLYIMTLAWHFPPCLLSGSGFGYFCTIVFLIEL